MDEMDTKHQEWAKGIPPPKTDNFILNEAIVAYARAAYYAGAEAYASNMAKRFGI